MSKPRSRMYPYSERELRTVRGFTTAIHFGRQSKHMPGQPNHEPTKSTITLPLTVLQELLELKAGTGLWRGSNREVVDFGVVIGVFRDLDATHEDAPTSIGTIHYSRAGAHVVPAAPITRRPRKMP
jgi:hypothetical protein